MSRSAWMALAMLAAGSVPAAAQQSGARQPAGPPLNDTQKLGQALFNQSCMVCHTKPQITSGMYGPALSRETAGGDEAVMRGIVSEGTPRMPGFKYQFEPAQIAAIVAYLKTVPKPAATAGGSSKGDVD